MRVAELAPFGNAKAIGKRRHKTRIGGKIGLNSAGLALCWTWGDGMGIKSPRVGIPAYVLIAQMLYQDSLDAALEEVQRATHAGWFAFVLADVSC